jgi:hypothetical protein
MLVFETPERTPLRSAVVAIVDRVDLASAAAPEAG